MYTAKITSKEEVSQGLRLTVEFSDGVKTISEQIIPQDEAGLKYWMNARLASLNSIEEIGTKYTLNSVVDLSDPVAEKTQTELDKEAYFSAREELKEAKVDFDLGLITKAEYDALLLIVRAKKV